MFGRMLQLVLDVADDFGRRHFYMHCFAEIDGLTFACKEFIIIIIVFLYFLFNELFRKFISGIIPSERC